MSRRRPVPASPWGPPWGRSWPGRGVGQLEIPNYSGTTFFKSFTGHNFEDRGGTTQRIRPLGGIWRSTAPIRTVRFRAASGALFSAGSTFGYEVTDPLEAAPGA